MRYGRRGENKIKAIYIMEAKNIQIAIEKPKWEVNFDKELIRLAEKVRPRILHPEFARAVRVKEIDPVLSIAEIALEKNNRGLDFTPVFIGPDTARTQDAVMQGQTIDSAYCAGTTDGRAIRIDFKGGTRALPKIKNDEAVINTTSGGQEEILVEGYAVKASGATFGYDQLRTQSPVVSGGVIGQKEQFGRGRVVSDARGEGKYDDLNEEKEYLLQYLKLGARVDVPIVLAKLDEPKALKSSGILVLAYRTPFNFENFLKTSNRDYDQAKYLIMHGISVWKREGLIRLEELDPIFSQEAVGRNQRLEQARRLTNFYIKNGSKIAGEDLAKIHQVRSLGNRNPQNMANDCGHRDVSDFPKPHFLDKIMPSGRYDDIHDDLDLFGNLIFKLNPDSGNELLSTAIEEYLQSYFSCGLGMSPKDFSINLMKDMVKSLGFVDQVQSGMHKAFRRLQKRGFFK